MCDETPEERKARVKLYATSLAEQLVDELLYLSPWATVTITYVNAEMRHVTVVVRQEAHA